MSRWLDLFNHTRSVIADPASYADRGRSLAISHEEREFMLDVLKHDPTLYLDELQDHVEAMTGSRHPIATIHNDLCRRLQLSKKVAITTKQGFLKTHMGSCWLPSRRIPRTHDAQRVSVMPAVSLNGRICSIAQPGSVSRLAFEFFLEEVLMPCMSPYPSQNSVLVMDNARIHHGGRVFSILKSRLKRARILTGGWEDAEIIKDFLPSFVNPDLM
ncbi:hypothetical protein MJO28_012681 [Puccinia striiformis f. sp. tritici]|uniref:Uncharacterized protein n=1 Tax=Puccinia striiformis f. sp. tritici TaxID=168172 RepID=A0ACC0E0K4_9BASI|nr:hypothetical protein MJO28_012681 [Puccinia striiformis f. sp. tritici]